MRESCFGAQRLTSVSLVAFIFLTSVSAQAQQTLSGIIRDAYKQPVEGATVVQKGTSQFTITDADGKFYLSVNEKPPFVIRVSFVGLKAQDFQIIEITDRLLEVTLVDDSELEEVVVTARRKSESVQRVPIPISVLGGELAEDAGAFNVNRIKELVPSVQLYSSNPRNTTLNIRGLGSTFGLTNDGIDPGVGFYVDGVYYARPAATTLDFIDLEQIEVLRGPQGTLFGKNTTAGAFNVTSRPASFTAGATFEVSYGNYGFIQAKSSVTGPVGKKLAGRISFSGTQRDGVVYNVATQKSVNDLNNLGWRAQLLYTPNERVKITFAGDATHQKPDGFAQVFAGVVPTLRAPYRQFENIIADLNYQLPSRNPFDRVVDHDTPWRSGNALGGVSVNVDASMAHGTLTSTTAWRYWNWDPSNDRDFTGLPVLVRSQANSRHEQWSQEIRYAGTFSSRVSGVLGVFVIAQELNTDPQHIEESGAAQWRFAQSTTSELWQTPGLLEGYGIKTTSRLQSLGAAAFAQADWKITDNVHVLTGLRYNYDGKFVHFKRETYGGLQTTDPDLLALKRLVYSDQAFNASVDESNLSGQLTVAYHASKNIHAFATGSTSYKPVGINLGGLPTSSGEVLVDLARIKPEYVTHVEVGVKTNPTPRSTLNVVLHNTQIEDYQTQVQSPEVGVNRGYLANAEKVRVLGMEADANTRIGRNLSLYGAVAYTDGRYVAFRNAPVPLEETGGATAFKDISGGKLPGISRWTSLIGGELLSGPMKILEQDSRLFAAVDFYGRSSFSSSPSPSSYLNVEGYSLVNGRFGFRAANGLTAFIWTRNALNVDYVEQLLPAAGNAGHYAGVLGDPRTYGITLRYSY